VTQRKPFMIAAGALALAATLWALPACPVNAQGSNSCAASCRATYGSCYKSSQDRARCEAQLQRCLENCIRSKR